MFLGFCVGAYAHIWPRSERKIFSWNRKKIIFLVNWNSRFVGLEAKNSHLPSFCPDEVDFSWKRWVAHLGNGFLVKFMWVLCVSQKWHQIKQRDFFFYSILTKQRGLGPLVYIPLGTIDFVITLFGDGDFPPLDWILCSPSMQFLAQVKKIIIILPNTKKFCSHVQI